jgi:hypothetical protein
VVLVAETKHLKQEQGVLALLIKVMLAAAVVAVQMVRLAEEVAQVRLAQPRQVALVAMEVMVLLPQ